MLGSLRIGTHERRACLGFEVSGCAARACSLGAWGLVKNPKPGPGCILMLMPVSSWFISWAALLKRSSTLSPTRGRPEVLRTQGCDVGFGGISAVPALEYWASWTEPPSTLASPTALCRRYFEVQGSWVYA